MNEQSVLPEFLSYDDLSSYLGVPKGTIYTWVHQKRIPHIRITGRLIRFRRSEVLAWLRRNSVEEIDSKQTLRKQWQQPRS